MNTNLEATVVKAAAEGVTKAVIESTVKPVVTLGLKGLKAVTDSALDIFTNRFSDFVASQYERNSYLNTIVFGNKKKLVDLYIPLTVVQETNIGDSKIIKKSYSIDRFNDDFLPTHKHVLVTDTAGMGKSTLSKYLFLQCVSSKKAVPIFVELRQLSSKTSIINFIGQQFNSLQDSQTTEPLSDRRIERIITRGGFCFFLDGYDEIPFKEREFVTRQIKEFFSKCSDNYFVITSRPESGLSAFPEFSRFTIKPLSKDESYELIKKYDQHGDRSTQLIKKLDEGMFSSVEGFLRNPLLTTLLFRCFEYKQQIPLKKHIFYRQVFDALFDWHDSTKDGYNTREKKCGLDQDGFHRVLRLLGFMSTMTGTVEGDVDTVLGWIRRAKCSCENLQFSESDFLDDIVKAVPVFVKDGLYYRWSHKSLAEYFASQYICNEGKEKQGEILSTILKSQETERFSNVLDQIYDIDYQSFKRFIILPTVKEFKKYRNAGISKFKSKIQLKEIELRLDASFGCAASFGNDIANFKEFKLNRNSKLKFLSFRIFPIALPTVESNQPTFLVLAQNSFGVIIDILADKKDPLVTTVKRQKGRDVALRMQVDLNEEHKIDLDDNNIINNQDNFVKATNLLLFTRGIIINHSSAEEMLNNSDSDQNELLTLTNELLGNLSHKK